MAILLNDQLVEPTIFPDGTSQVWKLEDYVNTGVKEFEILFIWENNEAEVFHLMQLIQMLRTHFKPITLITPYLPYARQDKRVDNDSCFALRTFVSLLTHFDYELLHKACDAHPANAKDFGIQSYYPSSMLDFVDKEYDVIIFPDRGAYARYYDMFKHKIIYTCDKVREQSTGKILSLETPQMDLEYKEVCVLDDLCDGGGTFLWLADTLHKKGFSGNHLDLAVTHGLFSKGVDLLSDRFDRIVTTDSLYRPEVFDFNYAAKQSPLYKEMKKMLEEDTLVMLSSD